MFPTVKDRRYCSGFNGRNSPTIVDGRAVSAAGANGVAQFSLLLDSITHSVLVSWVDRNSWKLGSAQLQTGDTFSGIESGTKAGHRCGGE